MKRALTAWMGLVVLGILGAQTPLPSPSIDPAPGAYTSPLSVNLRAPEGAQVRYRFLETPSAQTFPWTGPVTLEAMAGESRSYTLRLTTSLPSGEALTQDYRYQVSRPSVPGPTVTPVPGFFTAPVTVQPHLSEGWTLEGGGADGSAPVVLSGAAGDRRDSRLTARGPSGEVREWNYTVDLRDQESTTVDLVSPLPGTWANSQSLVATFRGVDRVLWSWGDRFDPQAARVYEGPVLLDRPGLQSLTLAGRSRVDGRWVERTVTWTNGTAAPPVEGWPISGIRTGGLDLPGAAGWMMSWDEGRSWSPARALHQEASSAVSRKVLAVQMKKDSGVFRYVYWLDARAPGAPGIQLFGGWNPKVVFSGATEALHRVTWTRADGRTLEDTESLWGPVGAWKVPDGVVGVRVTVQGLNGVAGPSASLGFPETGWAVPEWEPWDQRGPQTDKVTLPLGGRVLPRPGFWAVYELSERADVAEPTADSPSLGGAFLPMVPWGADRTFYVRFAWRDASGLTGPATRPIAVRVDRVPPRAPEILVAGNQVLVKPAEGEEEGTSLVWAVTSSRAASAATLTFQPYAGPLDLATLGSAGSGPLWLHAQAQDRSGNAGPARLNVALSPASSDSGSSVVQVDPDPQVGEVPVENGGVYPWTQFRLRPLEASRDLWVGVAEQGTDLPADWKARLQPWSGTVSRAVGRGERRTFLIFWNAKSADGWAWAQPKTLVFTLDQGPPAVPVLTGPWPLGPLGSAWTLTLKPGRPGDSLRYTSTLDGSQPADPLTFGESWPGSKTWDAPPLEVVSVRLRIAAVSVSGTGLEMDLGPSVTIDRRPPALVVPRLEPFTYASGAFTVPLGPSSGAIRYALTSDGSIPQAPTLNSPLVPAAGLVLEGVGGQSLLYRFRWRAFSASGIPGPVSDPFAVLVDRSGLAVSPSPGTDPERTVPLPHLTGFPPSGVSAQPVTLRAEWPVGTLRYEVREGIGAPQPVTERSPAWTEPLVLDSGEGMDRSFAVSVRGFSAEGRPLTAESLYQVRVDRAKPLAPSVQLVADSRRPEAVVKESASEEHPDEGLLYRLAWTSYPSGSGQSEWKSLGTEPVVFEAPGGALTRLRLQAFLRDEAGNEGPVVEQSLLIDQNVVYVAPGANGTGSRAQPLGALADAVDLAHREGKGLVFLASGPLGTSRTLDLDGLSFYGGLNAEQWETTASPGRTVVSGQSPFVGASLLESGDRDWQLDHVDLATGATTLDRVVVVRGASVTVRNSTWTWSGSLGGWDQAGGHLDWSNIGATFSPRPKASFLELRSVGASVRGLNLSATGNQGGVLMVLKDSPSLVRDITLISKKAVDYDGIWSVTGGQLTLDTARILAGEGSARSMAFLFKDADAVLWNTDIALYGSSSNTGFQSTGGRLELQKVGLSLLGGKEFNQALVSDHGDTILQTVQMKVDTGSYQGVLSLDGGTLTARSSQLQVAGGGQRVWGAQFLDPCLVTLQDVTWTLVKKTPGELWKIQRPWAEGSSVTGSLTPGW